MLSSLARMLRQWLKRDAIRVSPTERFWLSVHPPAVVFWQGERIVVERREEIPSEAGVSIRFYCSTPRGEETLIVHPGDLHLAHAVMIAEHPAVQRREQAHPHPAGPGRPEPWHLSGDDPMAHDACRLRRRRW